MKFKPSIILTLIVVLFSLSCKSGKEFVKVDNSAGRSYSQNINLETVLNNIPSNWETMQVPVTVSTTSPSSFKAGAKVYMTRDSSIYISFTVLGMEVAAIQVTNDSVYGVDKMHKRYVAEDIRNITSNYPINITSIQALLLGKPFIPGESWLTEKNKKDITLSSEKNLCRITPKKQIKPFSLSFFINSESEVDKSVIQSPHADFSMAYSNFTEVLETKLPQINQLLITKEKMKIEGEINWNWNKAKFNNPSDNKQIKIKSGYQRVSAAKLLSLQD